MIEGYQIDIQDSYQEVNLYSEEETVQIDCDIPSPIYSGLKIGDCAQDIIQVRDLDPCPIEIIVPPAQAQTSTAWANFAQGTPETISVSDESTTLLLANPARLYASFVNNTGQVVYIQYGIPAVYKRGKFLFPNSERTITLDELYTGPVYAICSTGQTALIDVIEGVR